MASKLAFWRRSPVAADPPVDPRIAARRDAVSSDERRRRQRRTATIGVLAVVATLAALATRTSLLDVDRISIAGANHVLPADVAAAAGVRHGDLLSEIDPASAAASVERLPWVAAAEVTTEWPGGVRIVVEERQAVARLSDGETTVVVGPEGLVLDRVAGVDAEALEVAGLPRVAAGEHLGPAAMASVALAANLPPAVRARAKRVQLHGEELQLSLRPEGTVRFGSGDDLDSKVLALATILERVDDTCLDTIDVRVPDVPVLTRDASCEMVSTEIRG